MDWDNIGLSQNNELSEKNVTYKPFVHLHLHTYHSILDGCGSIDDYIKLAKKFNHPAIAITDHGVLSGTFELFTKCKKNNIKPIIGMEAYVNDNMGEYEEKQYEGGNAHQIILVKNKQGYVNLNRLAYMSFTEGFYKRGRIKIEWLLKYKEGLIITTSCVGSYMGKLLKNKGRVDAENYFKLLKDNFQEDFYAEIHLNEYPFQKEYNSFILEMAGKYGVKTIIAGDVHYAYPEDVELQDTLIAINYKTDISKSFKLNTRSLFYSSSEDIYNFNKRFGFNYQYDFLDYCFSNTLEIAGKCNFEFELGAEKYPRYEPTEDVVNYFKTNNSSEIIKKLAFAKLKQKLRQYMENNIVEINDDVIKKYHERLNYEISVIEDKKMLDYFLVNWEIIRDYRSKGYEVGSARGSAAGCLLSWCLDITKIDPLRFDLYFERFLNPTRKGAPDLDIDYMTGTDQVTTDFLYQKYGKERVLSVSTFSTFNERGCLKDVVRAYHGTEATGYDSVVHQITKEMPEWNKVDYSLKDWFESWPKDKGCSPEVRDWLTNPDNRKIINLTLKLQGQIRGIGQHAAGVVITPSECWNDIPTNIVVKEKSVVTAFQEADGSGKDLSALGILKLDRLKLSTLNVIMETISLVKEHKGRDIKGELDYIDLNDKNIYTELRLGLNHGIFQFESSGMNDLIKNISVEDFNEMVAANALYRPGPMGIGAHEDYAKNKFNPKDIRYIHPIMEEILGESKGVLIFQEQVMFIANKIGGMSLGEGDMLRRYMDKAAKFIDKENKGELSEEERKSEKYQNFLMYWNKFTEGALERGYDKNILEEIKNWMIKYLGYSFNKSHCVSYSYIAAQTLYLKHYFSTEFYTSLLNHPKKGSGSNAKEKEQQWIATTISSAMSKGIRIKRPSRKSGWNWKMTGDKEITMGFSGINGLGEKAYEELVMLLKRENTSLDKISISKFFDLPFTSFNKTAFEVCLKAGVFDDWSESREHLRELKQKKKKKRDVNQMVLFDLNSEEFDQSLKNTKHPPTPEPQKRAEFMEVCNFDLEKIEELGRIKNELHKKAGRAIENILNFSNDDYYYFHVEQIKENYTKNGKQFLTLKVGDGISSTNLNVFPPYKNSVDNIFNVIRENVEVGGVFVSEFSKNEKGFINFKRNAKFKRVK